MTKSDDTHDYALPSRSTNTNRQSAIYSSTTTWTGSTGRANAASADGPGRGLLPHIKTLQEKARVACSQYGSYTPIGTLMNRAQEAVKRVSTDVNFKRHDIAWVEFLIGSEILLNIIPKHKDFATLSSDRGEWHRRYYSLCKQSDSQVDLASEIRKIIIEDNERSGVRPTGGDGYLDRNGGRGLSNNGGRRLSVADTPSSDRHRNDELFLPSPSRSVIANTTTKPIQHISQLQQSPQRKPRPTVHPKPESLQVHGSYEKERPRPSSTGGDPLMDRFAQLRVQNPGTSVGSTSHQRSSRIEVPSPTEYTPATSEDSSSMNSSLPSESGLALSTGRSSVPRFVPGHPLIPAPPPKIPLDSDTESDYQALPRAPSPAYDPAKSVVSPTYANAPTLNRKRSIIGTDEWSTSPSRRNSGSHYLPNEFSPPSRSTSRHPRKTSISAAELYECLRTSQVLLIDVRSREEFDEGHILAKTIMCIEPVSLNKLLSAEDLQERLVVSPDAELSYFERRDTFDWVVYYDQSTKSDRFLKGAPSLAEKPGLRCLYDTLYEFNDDRPLRSDPLLLVGGLDAWIDLVGPQALTTSKTAALTDTSRLRKPQRKSGRPLGRVPMASANSSLEVRRRRLMEQKALRPEEEQRWLEKARTEEVSLTNYQKTQSDGDSDSDGDETPPYAQTYEDFFRRYPEPSSMTNPYNPPPPPPARNAPYRAPAEAHQLLPQVPSRPPPAVPRPSYSGVSERESAVFSPTSRKTSASHQPFYQPRSTSHFLKLPRTGLFNFGVTCYMNATIQCLLATIPLSQFFIGERWRSVTQKNWKGSNGILPGIFANLIRSLWANDVQVVRPNSFRTFCARLKDDWGLNRQQDAKEFFDFVVDCLHEDLNDSFNRNPLRPLTSGEEMYRETLPVSIVSHKEWDRYTHREHSFISNLFAGQHASRLRCTYCSGTSTTYEAFYSISVEIPSFSNKGDGSRWDIYDCLASYCREERLSGDEVWKCPYCKCEREATKKITITRAPQFLVVHFKRFEMRRGDAKKVHTPIHFPLFGLDMEHYMVSPPSKNEIRRYEAETNDRIDFENPAVRGPNLYDAYAVMRHIGSSGNTGHYISLIRDAARSCWRKFDDERVSDFDPAALRPSAGLQNEQAYLVFYARAGAR